MLPIAAGTVNLTKDAEVKTTTDKSKLVELSCAASQRVKEGNEWVSRPSYYTIKVWLPKESGLIPLLVKGQQVQVQGHVIQERWEKDGKKNDKIVIEAQDVNLVGAKGSKGSATVLVIFSGVLGLTKDAEVKVTTEKSKLVEISGAANQRVKENGEWVDRPSYYTVKVWLPKESGLIPLLTKGQQVQVNGHMVQERWEKDGKKGDKIVVEAFDVSLVGGKKEEGSSDSSEGYEPASQKPAKQAAKEPEQAPVDEISEDEIPF